MPLPGTSKYNTTRNMSRASARTVGPGAAAVGPGAARRPAHAGGPLDPVAACPCCSRPVTVSGRDSRTRPEIGQLDLNMTPGGPWLGPGRTRTVRVPGHVTHVRHSGCGWLPLRLSRRAACACHGGTQTSTAESRRQCAGRQACGDSVPRSGPRVPESQANTPWAGPLAI